MNFLSPTRNLGISAAILSAMLLNACGSDSSNSTITATAAAAAMEPAVPLVGDARIVEEKFITDRLLELTITTSSFSEPTRVHVNLPTGYTPQKRWPLTLYLLGTNHTYVDFNESYGGGELVADYPSIVVAPTGRSGYWSDWFNQGAAGVPKYETFLIKELLPLLEQRFSTIGLRQGRAILGESMGGFGALMIAARHPDLFIAAASVSGTVNTNLAPNAAVLSASPALDGAAPDSIYGPRLTEEVRWRGHNPYDLTTNLSNFALWLGTANGLLADPSIGETAMDQAGCGVEFGVSNASVSLHEKLTTLGIAHTWREFGNGCHSIPNFQRQIKEVLVLFAQTFAKPPATPATINHTAIEPNFSVWNWMINTDPTRALEFMTISNASRMGLTLSGSGLTEVITPPFYKGVSEVTVEGGNPSVVKPDSAGRLKFNVDLGAPNLGQQYRPLSDTQVRAVTVNLRPQG